VALAAFAASEGHVDPVLATQLLVEQARRAGARVLHPVEVRGLIERKGRLRALATSDGEVQADVLVIACGSDTPVLARLAGFDVPLKESPGVLVHTRPLAPLVERVVLAPVAHLKQKPDGRVVVGADFEGSARADASLEAARRVLVRASSVLPALAGEEPEFVTMGFRPLPRDDFPVIGFAPKRRDVYVAVMHSGVTLSPAVANLAAMELLDGITADPLVPFRPERFAS
jgi:glycine/D-amino acid oxidase-like deaminating enzyme